MEQFKHDGQLLFNATFFSSLTCTHIHTQLTQTGRISVDCAHIWIDMLQLTGPMQDREKKYWFFANMAACWSRGHIHFHHSDTRGKKQRSVTLVLPVSMTTRIIQVRGGQAADGRRICAHWNHSWNALHPSLSVCLSLCLSITSAHIALSPLPQTSSLLSCLQQFSVAVWFKFPQQPGKPLTVLLNKALNPQLLPWNYPAATSKSL